MADTWMGGIPADRQLCSRSAAEYNPVKAFDNNKYSKNEVSIKTLNVFGNRIVFSVRIIKRTFISIY
jgi:hypothetical protein